MALLIVMLGTVAFDGASEGPQWSDIAPDIQDFFGDLGFSPGTVAGARLHGRHRARAGVIAAIYFAGIAGVRTVDRRPLVLLARTYVHTLVPVAAAYVIAHYFSFLAYNGQAIVYLASDPLGKGWDLFGTAGQLDRLRRHLRDRHLVRPGRRAGRRPRRRPDPGARPRAEALREPPHRDPSQYWMLAVMVGFTTFGLWLLSQANQ